MSDFLVVCGMSGAGRTQFGKHLEDLGWFVIDNLPPELVPKVADLALGPRAENPRVALVVGSGFGTDELTNAFHHLQASGASVQLVFLDASTPVLVRRFESTKRRHPFAAAGSLAEVIEAERSALAPLREAADLLIDTTDLTVYQLKSRVGDLFHDTELGDVMRITVMSFGYKFGIPADVDIVIDCRFLANPYWDEQLRPLTGRDPRIVEFLDALPETGRFLDRLTSLMELLIPAYRSEGKAYLTIALGCTGGRHRSVAMAEAVSSRLSALGETPRVHHRDIEK
ncbi:MAG: RNase adapter RapZ [Microthrixaceae bacterium]